MSNRPEYLPEWLDKHLPPLPAGKRRKSTTNGSTAAGGWRHFDRDAIDEANLEAVEVLVSAGGGTPFVLADGTVSVTRPGADKAPWETSATVGWAGPGRTRICTDGWSPFVQGRTYDIGELRAAIDGAGNGQSPSGEPTSAPPSDFRLRQGSTVAIESITWLWRGRIAIGGVTLLPGREGLGKSTVSYDLAAHVTRGTLEGDLEGEPADVVVVGNDCSPPCRCLG